MVHIGFNDGKMDKQRLLCSGHDSVTLVQCWLSWKFGNKSCRQIGLAQQSRVQVEGCSSSCCPWLSSPPPPWSRAMVAFFGRPFGRMGTAGEVFVFSLYLPSLSLWWPRQVRSVSSEQLCSSSYHLDLDISKDGDISCLLVIPSMPSFFCAGGRLTYIWNFCVFSFWRLFFSNPTAFLRPWVFYESFFYAFGTLISVFCTLHHFVPCRPIEELTDHVVYSEPKVRDPNSNRKVF